VCDENLLAGMKMFRKTLTFRKTRRKILDIYVSAALFGAKKPKCTESQNRSMNKWKSGTP
jgi:hypothetical protein